MLFLFIDSYLDIRVVLCALDFLSNFSDTKGNIFLHQTCILVNQVHFNFTVIIIFFFVMTFNICLTSIYIN